MTNFERRPGILAAFDYLCRKRPRRARLWARLLFRSTMGSAPYASDL